MQFSPHPIHLILSMKKRIEKIEIRQLFGRFDYSIDLRGHDSEIVVLAAPNGYGKSTILKIISNFASGNYFYFFGKQFQSIRFSITDEEDITISHLDHGGINSGIEIRSGNNSFVIQDPFEEEKESFFFTLERHLPFLDRTDLKSWYDLHTGETLDHRSILTRYGHLSPLRHFIKTDKWLHQITAALKIISIPTNRLENEVNYEILRNPSLNRNLSSGRNSSLIPGTLMVETLSREIKEKMQSAIRDQFEVGRRKETDFPARLLQSLNEGATPAKDKVLQSIEAVQNYEDRYGRLGLVPHADAPTKQLNIHAESTDETGILVLETYLEDILEKFALLENLSQHLEIFCDSINRLFSFKSISTSAHDGFVVRATDDDDVKKGILPLATLSSGEQHLIVLIGKLVFDADENSLVLIDEPEISFHPEWQENFLSIIEGIAQLNKFSVLVATHSPILIGDRWENVIELGELHRNNASLGTQRELHSLF